MRVKGTDDDYQTFIKDAANKDYKLDPHIKKEIVYEAIDMLGFYKS